jgi:hypothetical protein
VALIGETIMNDQTRIVERENPLDAFAKASTSEATSLVPAGVFAAPAERVFGAQPVAVHRDESAILQKIKTMAAAAGEYWYYRYPVKSRNPDGSSKTDWIEGPSIKCANAVSRMYGNCDVDTRVFDLGDSYMFYARFMDLETGYSLVRPFRQRKGQKTMKTDAGRAEDIVFQIGASKAIRNVINNALDYFTNFAKDEAKASIITTVGKKLEFYREKIGNRLDDLKIDIKRVEIVRGRARKDWLAADMALTIAELQAIQDGMATVDETYPAPGADEGEAGSATARPDQQSDLNQFAEGENPANGQQASSQPATTPAAGPSASGESLPSQGQTTGAAAPAGEGAKATTDEPKPAGKAAGAGAKASEPKNEAEYRSYALAYIENALDADELEKRWKGEKSLRNKLNVTPEVRDDLEKRMRTRAAELRKG